VTKNITKNLIKNIHKSTYYNLSFLFKIDRYEVEKYLKTIISHDFDILSVVAREMFIDHYKIDFKKRKNFQVIFSVAIS